MILRKEDSFPLRLVLVRLWLPGCFMQGGWRCADNKAAAGRARCYSGFAYLGALSAVANVSCKTNLLTLEHQQGCLPLLILLRAALAGDRRQRRQRQLAMKSYSPNYCRPVSLNFTLAARGGQTQMVLNILMLDAQTNLLKIHLSSTWLTWRSSSLGEAAAALTVPAWLSLRVSSFSQQPIGCSEFSSI